MNRSDSIAALASALAKAQAEFPAIPRDKTVKVKSKRTGAEYRFSYAPFEAILRATKDVRVKYGLCFSQGMTSDKALETVVMHSSGEWISHLTPVVIDEPGAQAVGSAITYAKRYGFCSAFGIQADDDDDGNAADGNHVQAASRANTATATMADEYEALGTDEKVWIDDLAQAVKSWVESGEVNSALDEMDAAIPYVPRLNSKDTEYKLALQSRLDSKTLTALKKARAEQLKKAA